jgi:hypothetical protein
MFSTQRLQSRQSLAVAPKMAALKSRTAHDPIHLSSGGLAMSAALSRCHSLDWSIGLSSGSMSRPAARSPKEVPMSRCIPALWVVIGLSAFACAQDEPVREGLPPELMLAQASERDGKVVVALTAHYTTFYQEEVEVEVNGIIEIQTVSGSSLAWTRLELVLDGKVLQAVNQDNEPLGDKQVLNRLKAETPVAVYRYGDEDISLAKAFRNGTVVLKGHWENMLENDLLQQAPARDDGAPTVPESPRQAPAP